MIKYIFKSVGGSFCSTLGRLLCYIFLGLIVAFLLSERASALTIENDSYLKYVDIRSNNNYSDNIKGTANYDSGTIYFACDYIANSYGCGVQFHTKEDLNFKSGKSYSFSLDIGVTGARLVKSTADKGDYFGLSTENSSNYFVAFDNWFNTSINSMPYTINSVDINYVNDSSQIITFSFTMKEDISNSSVFFFPFGLNKTGIYTSTIFEVNYLSVDSSNDDVINSIEFTSQEIIKNQNENNEKVLNAIDRVNKNFNSCRDSYNLLNISSNYTINVSEQFIVDMQPGNYIIKASSITSNVNTFTSLLLFYNNSTLVTQTYIGGTQGLKKDIVLSNNVNKILIYSGSSYNDSVGNKTTFNELMISKGTIELPYEPYGEEICSNKIDDLNETNKGILSSIGNILSFINPLSENFFAYKLIDLLIDALKSLFVPTNDQLYEIVNDSKNLSENFGFVGQSMNFFINIFTSLLGLVNSNGCLELPEFTIGATSLFDSITFWEARQVCLSDNVILNSNISTIRTITSIVLVGLFINFAVRQFFGILNKNDSSSPGINDNVSLRSGKS